MAMTKKTLIFSNSVYSVINFQYHLLKDFVAQGHDVVVCVPIGFGDEKSISSILNQIGVRFVALELNNSSLNIFADILMFLNLMRLIKKEAPDIMINYRIKPIIYGSIAARFFNVKQIYSVVTGLGYVFIGENFKCEVIRFLVKKAYQFAFKFNQKVFFQNQADVDLFMDEKILPRNKVVLINGSGVDIDEYRPSSFPPICTFFMAARLIKDKGVYEYISAARQIKSRYPQVKILLAGDLDSNPTSLCERELEKIVADGVVEYLGWVNNVREILAKTSVFVLPSYREGTSKAVLEAMASGRPIITTDAPGCRDPVIDGVNGYLVAIKNVDQLVFAMEKFILHSELIVKMGKESRRIAEEKYDVHKVNRVVLQAIGIGDTVF